MLQKHMDIIGRKKKMKKNRKKSTIKKRKRRAKEKAEENAVKLKELAETKKKK